MKTLQGTHEGVHVYLPGGAYISPLDTQSLDRRTSGELIEEICTMP